jgi:hypothetical protein
MLVVEFRDNTRAVMRDEVALQIVGTDVDGDVLVQYRSGELRPLTPCCHHLAEPTTDYKTGAECTHCGEAVDAKYVTAAFIYTAVERYCSLDEAVRNFVDGQLDSQAVAEVSHYLAEHCVA